MYTQLSALPLPTSAEFSSPSCLKISFTVRDHVRNVKRSVATSVTLPDLTSTGLEDASDDVVVSLTSPSQTLRAVLRDTKSDHGPSRFVEIWSDHHLVACKDVTAVHGRFYSDGFISSTVFSPSETSLLYVAEQNTPEASSDDPFAKFRYTPSFGEGLSSSKRPAMFICSWPTKSKSDLPLVHRLSIPTPTRPCHFGQAVFHSDTEIYATGYEFLPDGRLLGIKYCTNRPSAIWRIRFTHPDPTTTDDATVIDCVADKLTPPQLSCRSPRIFTSSKGPVLVYLSCNMGGPHMSTSSLHVLPLRPADSSASQSTILVPIVEDPAPGSFPGLYPPFSLAATFLIYHQSWDAPKIITHSTWGSRTTIVLIDTQTGAVKDVTPADSFNWDWTLLATDGKDRVVCARSSPSAPHQVLLGTVSTALIVEWRIVHRPKLPQEVETALSSLETKIIPLPNRHPVETIVIRSTNFLDKNDLPPCILVPHGGPHSTSTLEFNPSTAALALEGYTLALPNYTGSPGFGHSAILRLIGKCGSLDVEDCIESLRHLVQLSFAQFGPGKVFVYGGSHGGFLGAHLIGQYPDIFTAAALRNPVISVGEISISDIPDWYYAEFGFPYLVPSLGGNDNVAERLIKRDIPTTMTPVVYQELYSASPIFVADRVTADVLLLIGKDDLRVAPTQGYGYYHALRAHQYARGVEKCNKVEMLVFDGESHPLDGVECARVGWEATRAWFTQSLSAGGIKDPIFNAVVP